MQVLFKFYDFSLEKGTMREIGSFGLSSYEVAQSK